MIGLVCGICGAICLVWLIISARKECKRQGWKATDKKLF
jgi:hypothetical protein